MRNVYHWHGRSSTRRNIGGVGIGSGLPALFEPPKYVTEFETFKSDASTWEELDESESFVKIGDLVEEIFEQQEMVIAS